jgi:hypothetical protein
MMVSEDKWEEKNGEPFPEKIFNNFKEPVYPIANPPRLLHLSPSTWSAWTEVNIPKAGLWLFLLPFKK